MASPHIEDDEPGFFRRNLVMIIIGGIVLAVGGYFAANYTPSKSAPKRKMEMISISIPPPLRLPHHRHRSGRSLHRRKRRKRKWSRRRK